jgi:tRNA U34 5-methylaminomethyl-2-thiouridine-forming methyltransferase MnmC
MIIITKDGSETIRKEGSGITYHSIHGALGESNHVYIEAGLEYWLKENPSAKSVRIFEMGFGTGLNALLTAINAEELELNIIYTSIEIDPLLPDEVNSLNYGELLNAKDLFKKIHSAPWKNITSLTRANHGDLESEPDFSGDHYTNSNSITNGITQIHDFFVLEKRIENILDFTDSSQYDIIYFDAFAPTAQPELWTEEVFSKMYSILAPGGCLVTYCSKSIIRRAMMAAGFHVTKPPGPWGKREMVRALKKVS